MTSHLQHLRRGRTYGTFGRAAASGFMIAAGAAVAVLPGISAAASPLVKMGPVASVGTVLENSKGLTLYTYKPDTAMTSVCTGGCAVSWPPLVLPRGAKAPTAAEGVSGLGTIKRSNGAIQVTFRG